MERLLSNGFRKIFILACQAAIVVGSFVLANALRYDGAPPPGHFSSLSSLLLPLVIIKLSSFTVMHLLSGWWRYASIHDLILLVKANLLGSILFAGYLNYSPDVTVHLSATILLMDGVICLLIMSALRVVLRVAREYSHAASRAINNGTEKILIVGSGAAGQAIAREIRQNPHQKRRVVGFVDQDVNRVKQRFEGIQVLATIEGLKKLLKSQPISLVILANPVLCHKELRKIVMTCQDCGVTSKILPNIHEILNDKVSIRHVREVKLDDLLGRPPIDLDVNNIRKYLANKRVLVTGAAGSIGREVCRQIAEFGATCVILFDNAETPLFQVDRELRAEFPEVLFFPQLGDVKCACQIDYAFSRYGPEVVFHAAAYKHVHMSECNPLATLENNVIGSRNLINAADRYQVEHFVMISTDKAVNPSNIMGASKRAAEFYAQNLARKSQTKIVTVRFGNVLGSNGSVVPIFKEQILNGGPVTVTDPRVTRFFMTIPEAVQLVLQAGSMGNGGEIFVLNMGEQIGIVHLAEELIRLSGMTPYEDIDIVFTGLQLGEKLHEELLHSNENVMDTNHEKISVALSCWYDLDTLNRLIDKLSIACREMDRVQAMKVISSIVPEFRVEGVERVTKSGSSDLFKVRERKVINFPTNNVNTAQSL